jgi:transposase-like protein
MNIYNSSELLFHYQSGDRHLGTNGHPRCQLCEKHFYDHDKLLLHLMDDHHQCFICCQEKEINSDSHAHAPTPSTPHGMRTMSPRMESSESYFKNSHELQEHFKKCHFLCKQCKRLRVVTVFETEEEMNDHVLRSHPVYGNNRYR